MILITGASGFIGSRVLEKLSAGLGTKNLLALTSRPLPGVRCVLHDGYTSTRWQDAITCKDDVKFVLHLGAFTPKTQSSAANQSACISNIASTGSLLTADFPNLRCFVFASTIDVYGGGTSLCERSPTAPRTLYGASKLFCEAMIRTHCAEAGVQPLILRIGHTYGPGEEAYQKLIPSAIKAALAGNPLTTYGEGEEARSFIYVDDVAKAFQNSLECPALPAVINVVGSRPISVRETLATIVSAYKTNAEIRKLDVPHPGASVSFDPTLLGSTLLRTQTPFLEGIEGEISYMRTLL